MQKSLMEVFIFSLFSDLPHSVMRILEIQTLLSHEIVILSWKFSFKSRRWHLDQICMRIYLKDRFLNLNHLVLGCLIFQL